MASVIEQRELTIIPAPEAGAKCDKCGVSHAKHAFRLDSGGLLNFCNHCARSVWLQILPKCEGYGFGDEADLMPQGGITL